MSVVPFRRKVAVPLPAELYYQNDPRPAEAPDLRALSEIEQMYAYWGSDLGNAPR
jgi:hypothetical protein